MEGAEQRKGQAMLDRGREPVMDATDGRTGSGI